MGRWFLAHRWNGDHLVDTAYSKAYGGICFSVNEMLGKQIILFTTLVLPFGWFVSRKYILAGDFREWKERMVHQMINRSKCFSIPDRYILRKVLRDLYPATIVVYPHWDYHQFSWKNRQNSRPWGSADSGTKILLRLYHLFCKFYCFRFFVPFHYLVYFKIGQQYWSDCFEQRGFYYRFLRPFLLGLPCMYWGLFSLGILGALCQ